jgi:hypothetical protein
VRVPCLALLILQHRKRQRQNSTYQSLSSMTFLCLRLPLDSSRDSPFSMATRSRACIRVKEFDSQQGHSDCQLYTVAPSPSAKLTHSPPLKQCGCTYKHAPPPYLGKAWCLMKHMSNFIFLQCLPPANSKHFYTVHYLSRPSVSHFATHMLFPPHIHTVHLDSKAVLFTN